MTDVIAMFCNGWCYCHYILYWLMLLPIMLWLMLLPLCFILADVIANHVMWDIVPHFILCLWQMLWPLCTWLMLLPWWQMEIATYAWADVFALYITDGQALWQLMNNLWQMVWPLMWLADVIAMVADGIGHCWNVSMYQGRCLKPCWQMLYPWVFTSSLVLWC